ncbi:MAG TPA: hypothetical protein PLX39_15400 [Pyrinomonadaceae bacterium]|nr:hypothetical protein [Pyrinomonadaceae bacterium]
MIKIEILKSFGTIRLEAANEKDVFKSAGFWTEIPDVCPECEADLFLRQRTAQQKYEYFEIVCRGAEPHVSNLGQFTTGGLYYKNTWEPDRIGRDREEHEAAPAPHETQRAESPVSDETKARLLAEQGFVSKKKDGYHVADPAKNKVFVVRKSSRGIVCDCPAFLHRPDGERFECAHILAVRYAAKK